MGRFGDCDLPEGIVGLAANVTAVNATEQTNVRFYAEGDDVPETANLNPTPGAAPTPNAVNVPLNPSTGQFRVYNRFGSVGVFIDIMGYYDDHTHDDRYPTRDEVADQIRRSGDAAWARLDSIELTTDDQIVVSVTVATNGRGVVIANSSGLLGNSIAPRIVRCSISTDDQRDQAALQASEVEAAGFAMIGGTRGFDVTDGTSPTMEQLALNLVCDVAVTGTVELTDAYLTATFVPTPDP